MAEKNQSNAPMSGSKASSGRDAGEAEMQAMMDEETEKGFRGTEVDPTPNENYTVAGVTSGAPTPETDPTAAATAKAASQGKTDLEEKA